jgi:N-acetylglucosamine-6-phosphate deacetylase
MTILAYAPRINNWKITLAPDLPGAMEFIKRLCEEQTKQKPLSIKINIGHSNAPVEFINQSMRLGAAGITHCGNACKEPHCRQANVTKQDITSHLVQWVLNNPQQCPPGIELIVDGHHLSESFVQLIFKTIGHKINLITDALGATGLADGAYTLGTLPIYKKGIIFYVENAGIESEPLLAGSAASLYDCAQRFSRWTDEPGQQNHRINAIYFASVYNPRISSLSSSLIQALNADNQNGVLFNDEGKLVLSLCQGKIWGHPHEINKLMEKV